MHETSIYAAEAHYDLSEAMSTLSEEAIRKANEPLGPQEFPWTTIGILLCSFALVQIMPSLVPVLATIRWVRGGEREEREREERERETRRDEKREERENGPTDICPIPRTSLLNSPYSIPILNVGFFVVLAIVGIYFLQDGLPF